MAPYQPTPEEEAFIRELNEFRAKVKQWSSARHPEQREQLRSSINRRLENIQEIVHLAGCHQTVTFSPPPMIGGLVARNIDPFDHIFTDVFGYNLEHLVFDMIDKTIGVIESGRFKDRKSRLQKPLVRLGRFRDVKSFWCMDMTKLHGKLLLGLSRGSIYNQSYSTSSRMLGKR